MRDDNLALFLKIVNTMVDVQPEAYVAHVEEEDEHGKDDEGNNRVYSF